MTYTEVAQMIAGTGLANAYYQFTEKTAQPPPFICFYYTDSADLAADDTNYVKVRPLAIELYTDSKDFDLEAVVENALNANGLVYEREETPLDSERMYMVVFRTTVIIQED